MRRRLRQCVVKRLLHILPDARISGRSMFALDLIQSLQNYVHTVVVLDEPENADQSLAWSLAAAGAIVLYAKPYCHSAASEECAAALIYGAAAEDVRLPADMPKIGYAYHGFDSKLRCDVVLFPSEHAAHCDMHGKPITPAMEYEVLAPGIKTRTMRRLGAAKDDRFSVGVLSSSENGKYPAELIDVLARTLPDDVRIIVTQSKSIRHLAGDGRMWSVPVMMESTLKGLFMSNVVVYASAPGYCTEYGRTCMEALAAKRPVVCERRGAPAALLKDGVHALMFDRYDEVADKIMRLRKDVPMADKLAATGQVLASWHDVSNHAGALKGILYSLGA